MNKSIKKFLQLISPLAVLIIFFSTTNPNDLSLPFLLVPVVLIAASVYFYTLQLLSWLNPRNKKSPNQKILALVLACSLTTVVVLQSIDQLSLKDFSLFCLFTILFAGYIKRINTAS